MTDHAYDDFLARRFETYRPHLRAVAHRMLGSLTDADDAVQEAWFRLSRADTHRVDNLGGWLTTVVGRVCLDMLRTRRSRAEEPLDTTGSTATDPAASAPGPEQEALLADSVGAALLVVLETLTPAERLAFVLYDLFAVPYEEIAPILDRTPAAARQLASRARRRIQGASGGGAAGAAAREARGWGVPAAAREARPPGTAAPEAPAPGTAASEARAPGAAASEVRAPGAAASEVRAPGAAASEVRAPGAAASEVRAPGAAASEVRAPGAAASEVRAPGAAASGAPASGATAPEARTSDAPASGATAPEARHPGAPAVGTPASRAQTVTAVDTARQRELGDAARQRELVDAFLAAARDGDFEGLLKVLAPDVVVRSQAGVVTGARTVAAGATRFAHLAPAAVPALIDGAPGAVVLVGGRPERTMSFTVVGDRIAVIEITTDLVRLSRSDISLV